MLLSFVKNGAKEIGPVVAGILDIRGLTGPNPLFVAGEVCPEVLGAMRH
jgi:hypothetical protein